MNTLNEKEVNALPLGSVYTKLQVMQVGENEGFRCDSPKETVYTQCDGLFDGFVQTMGEMAKVVARNCCKDYARSLTIKIGGASKGVMQRGIFIYYAHWAFLQGFFLRLIDDEPDKVWETWEGIPKGTRKGATEAIYHFWRGGLVGDPDSTDPEKIAPILIYLGEYAEYCFKVGVRTAVRILEKQLKEEVDRPFKD